jgi:ribose/xylose/arabinose/galactoside ABC-type transport system permease subunit
MTSADLRQPVHEVHAGPRSVLRRVGRRLDFLRSSGLLVAIVLLLLAFTWLTPPNTFDSVTNALGLLRSMSTITIIALGAMLVIITGEIDISFGFVYGLTGMVMAVAWLVWGWPVWLAIILALAVAIAFGTFNAALTTRLGIPSFIVTLGSGTLALGFTLLISNSRSYNVLVAPAGRTLNAPEIAWFQGLSNQDLPFDFPMQGIWMIVLAFAFYVLLDRSLFGFRLKAIGGNPEAARVARLSVNRYKWLAFVALSTMACLAAILDFSFIGSVQPDSGQTLLFPVFAAVIIGGASLYGGSGTALGTVSGALLLATLTNGFAVLTVGAFVHQMFLGIITIVAVVIDRLTLRR